MGKALVDVKRRPIITSGTPEDKRTLYKAKKAVLCATAAADGPIEELE